MSNVISISGAREAPKASQSRMDTLIITPEMVNEWRIPPFQRPLRITEKVRMVCEEIKKTQTIEGVVTLGKIKGDNTLYVVDGQHRLEGFKIATLKEAIVDVRIMTFANMAEMAEEFVRLNTALVKMRPDDILRGLEHSTQQLTLIRKHCEFVGYDNVRRGGTSAILSMSALIRCWASASFETPSSANHSGSAANMINNMEPKAIESLIAFLNVAHAAWGRDPEYYRLWGNLNLSLCMWLWNRLVMDRDRTGKRYVSLNAQEFKRCMMSLSADTDFVQWLVGRQLSERDRSPCYSRLRAIFARRLAEENGGVKPVLPLPAWATK